MTGDEKDRLIRQYAAGEVTWSALRKSGGFDSYLDVLAALGERDLRQPIAPMEGPNVDARKRGIEFLRQRLLEQAKP